MAASILTTVYRCASRRHRLRGPCARSTACRGEAARSDCGWRSRFEARGDLPEDLPPVTFLRDWSKSEQ